VAAIERLRSDAMKGLTVDLVVTGDESAAVAAAVDAVRRGQRVLVVLRSGGPRVVQRLRRLCQNAKSQLTVMTNAEVVCVDGVGDVEAVVVRYTRTGGLCAVNTSAFLSCDGSTHPPRVRMSDMPLENRKIEPERGDVLETTPESEERKSKSENGTAGVRGRDSRRTLIDRTLLS
jgi:hypothetical protein